MEFYSMLNTEITRLLGKSGKLEKIILSEVTQAQKDKH